MGNTLDLKRLNKYAKENSLVLFFVLLIVMSALFVPRFIDPNNLVNVMMQIAINALLATGMTFVILSNGIDLSVGSVAALAGIVATVTIKFFPNASILTGVLVILATAIVIGGIFGGIMALNIAKLKVPPFIATLAIMSVARGLAYVYTESRPVFGLPDSFSWMGIGYIGPIPVMVIVTAIIMAIAHIVLTRTCFGRYVFAVGSNEEVAKLSGINIVKIKFYVYMICSVLAALGGAALASRLQAGQPNAAQGYELNAIAAVAMGGTSMSGGRGGIIQTTLGLVIIGVINNALSLLGVSSYWQTIAMGIIILVAVIFDLNKDA